MEQLGLNASQAQVGSNRTLVVGTFAEEPFPWDAVKEVAEQGGMGVEAVARAVVGELLELAE